MNLQWYYDLIYNNPTIAAALISTLVSLAVLTGQNLINWLFKKNEKKDFENAVVSAIYEELSCLYNNYSEQFDKAFLNTKDDEYIRTTFTITQDFFTIYHNNSQNIGRIKSAEIRNSIVQIYILLKRLVENILYYNTSYNSLMERRKEFFCEIYKISGQTTFNGLSINDAFFINILSIVLKIDDKGYDETIKIASVNLATSGNMNLLVLVGNDKELRDNLIAQTKDLKNDYSTIKKRIIEVTQMIKEQYKIKSKTIIEQNITEIAEKESEKENLRQAEQVIS